MNMLAPDLSTQVGLDEVGPNHFVGKCLPLRIGNNAPIAYGGITAGSAVLAACKTVKPGYYLFSVLGSFHGPTRTDRHLYCRVFETRNTKTFATRRVVAYQIQDDKSERVCAELMADFHVKEQGMYQFTIDPDPQYFGNPEDPSKTATNEQVTNRLVRDGIVSQSAADAHSADFALTAAFFDVRHCTNSVSGQNLNGLGKTVQTTQDHLPINKKSSAEWCRARHTLNGHAEQMAALSFWLDGALSFIPLISDHKDLYDSGACSTLDFALRVLIPETKMEDWHLRERKSLSAHSGRTYAEGRLWNQAGQVVAIESQTCILRPLKKKKSKGKL